ncbi:MAG: ABC transporter ATP-binding protein [bacterium]|nr:ABC transporter ATP-binding protein [bacterium]MDE0188937.1 ABC transporter ATP-binding protein [bacterium]MDE0230914.1 ABC transporter ATP-binding protein [bacterium]MDE0234108.1 ABC transporter ATP-binding protein [bacterium]
MPILETSGLTRMFGGLSAVDRLDLSVEEGEIRGLIGPNGSGKTTALNLITGYIKPTRGVVRYQSSDVSGEQPHELARLGLVRTFQITTLFENLTVRDNVLHGSHLKNPTSLLGALTRSRKYLEQSREMEERVRELLAFVGLAERIDAVARDLSAGEHRYLEIAIALAAKPKMLLLDEPATGLNPEEAAYLMNLIRTLRSQGVTVLLVEHNMRLITNICTRITVLNFGAKIAEGTPEEIVGNPDVITAYLGKRRGA